MAITRGLVNIPGTMKQMERSTRFELISKLGEGGMGVVYEALDRERNMRVALKMLRRLDASSLYQFKREFRALSDLSHPNIVALYELVSEGDDWFLSMELVQGTDFITYVRGSGSGLAASDTPSAVGSSAENTLDTRVVHPVSRRNIGSPVKPVTVAPGEVVALGELIQLERLTDGLAQLAQALYALHSQGMVHRDLKPSNVRVTPKGRVVLMDFGIVAETADESKVRGSAVGTPMYMAPEQAEEAPPTAAADWYAFGVLLYQALAGRLPFRGPTEKVLMLKRDIDPPAPSAYTSGIPADLEALCMELMAREPEDRPQGYDVLTRLGVGAESISRLTSEVTFIGPSEFVGRVRHIESLGQAFEQARSGAAVCVFAEGASGMGKTTLLRRFVYELQATHTGQDAPLILSGRCHERESLSYKAFDGVIDRLSRELLEQPAEIVDRLLPDDIDLLTRLFPVLRRIPGVQVARPLGGRNLLELRTRAIAALRDLLDRLGEWRPVVMRIEDLQWADSDSVELLVDLLRPPAPRCLLLLASLRTDGVVSDQLGDRQPVAEALGVLDEQVACHWLEIGPMDKSEQQLLVAKLAGERNLPSDLDDSFWAEAEGNPLLLNELVRFASEAPELLRGSRRPQLDDVIARRIARLPDNARMLVEIIAVAGEPTPLLRLADAIGLSDDDRERASATLRVAKLARIALPGHEPWLNVQHDKIRETVLTGMAENRRQDLHRRLARALERWDSASVASLARHWLAAGDRDQAGNYLVAAARAAAEKTAFDRAAGLYSAALDLIADAAVTRQLAVLQPLGSALTLSGRHYEASQIYGRAASLSSGELSVQLNRQCADNLLRSGRTREGMQKLSQVMKQLGTPLARARGGAVLSVKMRRASLAVRGFKYTPRTESEIPARDLDRTDALYTAAAALGMVDRLQGSVVQSQHLKEVLAAGEEKRVCRGLALEMTYLAITGGKHGRRAEELSHDVLLQARKIGDPYLIGLALLGSAVTSYYGSRMRAAMQTLGESLDTLSGVARAEWERITGSYYLCLAAIHTGEWKGLQHRVKRAIEKADRRHDMYASSLFRAEPNTWYSLIGDRTDEAHQNLDAALRGWPGQPFCLAHFRVALSRALTYLYQGDGGAAARTLDEVSPHLSSLMLNQMPLLMSEFLSYRARAAMLVDDLVTARKLARRLAKLDVPTASAMAGLVEAHLCCNSGDQQQAERLVSAAVNRFNEVNAAHMEAASQYRLGQLLGGKQGNELMATAVAWFAERDVAHPLRMIATLTWTANCDESQPITCSTTSPNSPSSRAGGEHL